MDKNIGWELYRSFLGVMNSGSLSGAARTLGLTQPTVGRHVSALEQALGVTLFVRSQGGLQPTREAESLKPYAQEMANIASALMRVAVTQGETISGVVRVAASDIVGVEVLPPMLANLNKAYPNIRVELVLSNQVQDLLHREADIAVRMFRPAQTQLIARKVGSISLGLHATDAYLNDRHAPLSLEDLNHHALIGFDQETEFIRKSVHLLPENCRREHFTFRADSDLAQLALIRAGAGIGICQVPIAKREGFTAILPEDFVFNMEVWMTMHEDLRNSPAYRTVFDVLAKGLMDYSE